MENNERKKISKRIDTIASIVANIILWVPLLVLLWFFPDFPFHAKGFMRYIKAFVLFFPLVILSVAVYALVEKGLKSFYGLKE